MLSRTTCRYVLIFFLGFNGLLSVAQSASGKEESAEEFRRKAMEDLNDFTDSAKQDLAKFREQANKEYYQFLQNAWIDLQSSKPVMSYKVPKPALVPYLDANKMQDESHIPVPKKQPEPEPKPETKSIPVPEPKSEPESKNEAESKPGPGSVPIPVIKPDPKTIDMAELPEKKNQEKIDFYSLIIGAPLPSSQWPVMASEINSNTISDYWQQAAKSDMHNWLAYVASIKDTFGGGDYAVYQVVNKISENYYNNAVTARLFCWYSLMQNGFDVKIGYTKSKVYLLIFSRSEIFGRDYFLINNKKYYTLDEDSGTTMIHICPGDFKLTSHTLNPDLKPALALKSNLITRKLSFNFNNKDYSFDFRYCPQHINYLFQYPQLTYSDYLASESGEWFDRQLRQQFTPVLVSMNEHEAIQFLLSFVQFAFEYQDDLKQFGREKWFFPEEILNYPYSDCDDRAIFFGYLVKKLTGHKVIGLLYENHICTAVRFNENTEGDKIFYKNESFVVCDPTFVGAPIGKSMPEYKNAMPKIYE